MGNLEGFQKEVRFDLNLVDGKEFADSPITSPLMETPPANTSSHQEHVYEIILLNQTSYFYLS